MSLFKLKSGIAGRTVRTVLALLLVSTLAACATPPSPPPPGEMEIRSGVIEQITDTQIQSNHHPGVGAVMGGVVGLGVGSLIGNGNGRDVAMVLGTLGGAVVGNEVQKKYDQPAAAQQIIVRLHNGVLVSITQPPNAVLFKGQKVFVEGSGENARVVPKY
jgi:outer membrane lipoprotein SlyB